VAGGEEDDGKHLCMMVMGMEGGTKTSTGAGAGVLALEDQVARIPKVAAVAQQVEAERWRDLYLLQQQP
jgi:hypothetical protein